MENSETVGESRSEVGIQSKIEGSRSDDSFPDTISGLDSCYTKPSNSHLTGFAECETDTSSLKESNPDLSLIVPGEKESLSPVPSSYASNKKMGRLKSSKGTDQLTVFPYKAPVWSGKPDCQYFFELIKGGILLSTVNISGRPYTTFGRLDSCDVMLEHPSVSRYHAVVQYCAKDSNEQKKGFYIYDLGSTHGTFLNKQQIKPEVYYRLHVGYVLKFGGSSRLFVLTGDEENEEEEEEEVKSEISILHEPQTTQNQSPEHKKQAIEKNEDGVDWGLGDDAVEEISTENPFALSTCNEELYIEDPKKTLRGWFEREDCELEYDVEEKGFSHFLCRVELPIDSPTGEPVYAEASVKGKKKEAVVACALEACRILDRYGLLRQAQHEGHKRKQRNWEENDYYDSDEDTYLDRTGTIEKKREFRRKMLKKDAPAETFDSLVQKLKTVEEEICDIDKKLQAADKQVSSQKIEEADLDTLDAYMSSLQTDANLDKKTKSKLKLQLAQLQQEQRKLKKLIDIARPTNLPALTVAKHPSYSKQGLSSSGSKKQMPMIGSMRGNTLGKFKKQVLVKPNIQHQTVPKDDIEEEEEEEDEEEDKKVDAKEHHSVPHSGKPSAQLLPGKSVKNTKSLNEAAEQIHVAEGVRKGQMQQKDDLSVKRSKKATTSTRTVSSSNDQCEYDVSNPDYSVWLPPENQSGDGYTHLNAKYGY